jgi:hypothetical protein
MMTTPPVTIPVTSRDRAMITQQGRYSTAPERRTLDNCSEEESRLVTRADKAQEVTSTSAALRNTHESMSNATKVLM